ncbi:MAG: DNA gyrase C-terminal beta-propeller domain-containing protein [Oscillospiraceae bacterium]
MRISSKRRPAAIPSQPGLYQAHGSRSLPRQKRGGRGVNAQSLKDDDFVRQLFIASTHDYILFFSNMGRVHRRKGYLIPEAGRTARGTAIVNVLPLESGERITAMLLTREMENEEYLVMVTRNGTVKRIKLGLLNTARKAGIRALSLDEDDELIAVLKTTGQENIILVSHNGMAICFHETDIRPSAGMQPVSGGCG